LRQTAREGAFVAAAAAALTLKSIKNKQQLVQPDVEGVGQLFFDDV
jgi:hypothetical protein